LNGLAANAFAKAAIFRRETRDERFSWNMKNGFVVLPAGFHFALQYHPGP
jgi:hypothetical protein